MSYIQKLSQLIILFFSINFLGSCQVTPPTKQGYLDFEEGIRQFTYALLTKLQERENLGNGLTTVVINPFVVNPFLDFDSGQVLQVSFDIETLLIDEAHKYFRQVKVNRTTDKHLKNAQYMINGFIKSMGKKAGKKLYQISASIVNLKTQTIVTNGSVWIASKGLNYEPTPSYKDNPMYAKGKLLEQMIETVSKPVGTEIDEEQLHFVQTKALLVTAQSAYDNKDYQQARQLFEQVVQQPSGQIIEAYGGLYAANLKLANFSEAEKIFGKMIAIGVKNGTIPIKFLFQTNLNQFVEIPEIQQQYNIWLRQMSLYLKNHSDKCINIIGHTSKTGEYNYNKALSKRRAKAIQGKMRKFFPAIIHRSRTIGKGSDETIVGTMPDNFENVIDRRVEFQVLDCSVFFKNEKDGQEFAPPT